MTIGLDSKGKKIKGFISGYANAERKLESFNFSYNLKLNPNIRFTLDSFYNKGNFNNSNLDLTMFHTTKGVRNKLSYEYGNNTIFQGSNSI